MKYSLGIDIGGTNISAGVVNSSFEIISRSKIKTNAGRPYEQVLEDIVRAGREAVEAVGLSVSDMDWVGLGCPGTCNGDTGYVEYANNMHWENVPLRLDVEKAFGVATYLDNDANAAAFGEYVAGAAKGAKNAVVITIGTGLGAGIIIDGRIYAGSNFAGAEIGHTVISVDGPQCTCGRKGCFEAFSSATALIRITKEFMSRNPQSALHSVAEQDGKISARTAFKGAKQGDKTAKEAVDYYIKHLACGVANVINVFQPDILCIGGGVCNEGDNLIEPLKKLVEAYIYSKNSKKNTKIEVCRLGNDAGIIGAALLGKNIIGRI